MSYYGDQKTLKASAAADLSANRFHVMRLSAKDAVNVASLGTSSEIAGVLQNLPQSGEDATVAYSGESKITAGAAIAVNAHVTTNSSGRAVTVTSGSMAIGRVLETATADGDIVACLLYPPVRWTGAA